MFFFVAKRRGDRKQETGHQLSERLHLSVYAASDDGLLDAIDDIAHIFIGDIGTCRKTETYLED